MSGIAAAGDGRAGFLQRAKEIGLARYGSAAFPCAFWDIFGEAGHPVRTTVEGMGPLLLLLGLSCLCVAVVVDILRERSVVHIRFTAHYGVAAFVLWLIPEPTRPARLEVAAGRVLGVC